MRLYVSRKLRRPQREYIVWVYGDDSVMKFNGVVVLGNRIGAQNIKNRNGLLYTDFNRTVYDALANEIF